MLLECIDDALQHMVYTICISWVAEVYHMHISCVAGVYHMYTSCVARVYHIYILVVLLEYTICILVVLLVEGWLVQRLSVDTRVIKSLYSCQIRIIISSTCHLTS